MAAVLKRKAAGEIKCSYVINNRQSAWSDQSCTVTRLSNLGWLPPAAVASC